MRWGRRWGTMFLEKGFKHFTFWGGEGQYKPGRVEVRKVRTRITPCDSCRRRVNCSMYQSFTRHRLTSEYAQGTNILHMCEIYLPTDSPGPVDKRPPIDGRTSGKEPT